jgi:membrane associated rhomboid family serine protease
VSTPERVTVFRSPRRRDCEERLLMLTAVGIAAQLAFDGQCVIEVAAEEAPAALSQLTQYERENRAPAPLPPPPVLHAHAWVGCVLYVAVLTGVAFAIAAGVGRLDAFELGDLDAARVQAGQWWRAWTALTLHVDAPHLAANLGAGIWFGYLAARQLGAGLAWFLIVSGGAVANLLEGLYGPPEHRAVGASTAVFAALGLMAAYSWRERLALPQRWARRWGPLVAGVALLGWTGSAGEETDLVGHVAGFIVGALLGAVAAVPAVQALTRRVPQWLSGLAALASIVLAWTGALRS